MRLNAALLDRRLQALGHGRDELCAKPGALRLRLASHPHTVIFDGQLQLALADFERDADIAITGG